MTRLAGKRRAALVAGTAAALLVAGAVAGAAGDYFIIGQSNDSGTSQSILLNAGTGAAFTLKTTNVSTNAAGIFGWSSSTAANATRGVYGRADGPNSYGVYARQSGTEGGAGAALYADGLENQGIIATSNEDTAITGTALGCTGFLCGSNGVFGRGSGFAAGVSGDGTGSIAGVQASEGALTGLYATSTTAAISAIYADSSAGTGVYAFGEGSISTLDDCGFFYCAGAVVSGDNGVLAETGTGNGVAVYGFDQTAGGTSWGLGSDGDAFITGDLSVSGTCTGCTAAATAVNASGASLNQGDAVALAGVRTAPDGSIVLVIRAAKKGDQVIGVVDRALSLSPTTATAPAGQRKVWDSQKGAHTVKTSARQLTAQLRKWLTGGTTVSADAYLRIVTSGIFTMKAGVAGAVAGDSLAVGDTTGKLSKAGGSAARGTVAGKFLGKLQDGRTVLLIDPS